MFPTTIDGLRNDEDLLLQLREAAAIFSIRARSDDNLVAAFKTSPIDAFLEYAPAELRTSFPASLKPRVNDILRTTEVTQPAQEGDNRGWGSALCKIGLWAAIVAALAGAIALSQGAAIAPLIALDAGILPVLAAITGLSEGVIAGLAAGGTFTFAELIDAACE